MRPRGFTIIELMIVIVLIAIIVTGAAMGMGALTGGKLQSSAWMIVSASRYAYSRAVSRGTTVRMVLDFDARTVQLQETSGRVVLNRDDETGVGLNREEFEDEYKADGSVEEHGMEDRLKDIGPSITGQSLSDGTSPTTFTDPFLASMQSGFAGSGNTRYRGPRFEVIEGRRGEARTLPGDVGFSRVYSEHAPAPIEGGGKNAFVYYFPGGTSELTYIQLSDFDDDRPQIATVVIHPLTGAATVFHEEKEPDGLMSELQEAER